LSQLDFSNFFTPEQITKLAKVHIGIAGVGGLGSNVAMILARSGLKKFTIVDMDKVELSNLNRQHYFHEHIGLLKVDALAIQMKSLCSDIEIIKYYNTLNANNIFDYFAHVDIIIEALDDAIMKRCLVEAALQADMFIISASGIAGYGGLPMQKKILTNKIILIGDFTTDVSMEPPLAPRVVQAAAMQADAALELILSDSNFNGFESEHK